MRPGNFLLNGESSEDYGAIIQTRPLIKTPVRKVDFKDIYGRSGDMPFDEEAYRNTEMELLLYIVGDKVNTASINRERVFTWFDSSDYQDFIPYFDNNKIYKVMLSEPPEYMGGYEHNEGQDAKLKLTIKPYKYYVNSEDILLLTQSTFVNPYLKPSLPIIKVVGDGDITLTINGRDFVMKGIDDHIILDSNISYAYKDVNGVLINENSKTYTRGFPYLDVGNNLVQWVGNVSKIELKPNWRCLA